MQVSQIAKKLEVSADTIRYYARIGLVAPGRGDNGYKQFSEQDLRKLQFALRAKSLGFSLTDIKILLDKSAHSEAPCRDAREIIAGNLERLRVSIEQSMALYQRMQQAVSAWEEMPDQLPDGEMICCLIEEWDAPAKSPSANREGSC